MGLFTSLALGGALGLFAGRRLAPRPQSLEQVPGAVNRATRRPAATNGPPAPPDASVARSEAQLAAQQASVRQRRRAGTGLGTVLARPAGTAPLATASLQPRTLGGF